MVRENQEAAEDPAGDSSKEKQHRQERMSHFYQGPKTKPAGVSPGVEKPRTPSLTDADPVFRSEFNTVGYLSIGFSLIALLLIGILFFRPPKPEEELRALAEAQLQTRESLESLAGRIATLDRRAERSEQNDLVRNLRITYLALSELKERGSPGIRAEAEVLQSQIEALLNEVGQGARAGRSP